MDALGAEFFLQPVEGAFGLGEDEEARGFLIHAFASEVLTSCKVEPLRQYVEAAISKKLGVAA
jgi:hypothetical protein